MQKNLKKKIIKKKKKKIILISIIFFLSLLFNTIPFNNLHQTNAIVYNNTENLKNYNHNLKFANEESILFQDVESPLNITDYGNLFEINQEVLVSNNEETNLTYYLDDEHGWNVSRIETSINNIQDTREWVNNSGFINNVTVYSEDVDLHNIDPPGVPLHNYDDDLDEDPTNPANIHSKIYHHGALAIRVHFDTLEMEPVWDCVFIWDKNNKMSFCETGFKYDFFSPWILGDGVNITIGSDYYGGNYYGYYIDRYEYVNASSGFLGNLEHWGNNTNDDTHNYGSGWIGNNTAMYTALYSRPYREDHTDYFTADYTKGNYSEIYQNLTIPRGKVVDAEISFAYYADFAMESNDNFIYFAINSKKVYTLGLREVVEAGRDQWHDTGKINLDLWVNNSKIFDNPINDQEINISVGIMSGASVSYSGFEDAYQQVIWFDNVSLSLTTIANSTQEGINLTIKTQSIKENLVNGNKWGIGTLNLEGNWDSNPITLTFNTTSPNLSFNLNTSLFGYHKTFSKINQLNDEGVNYKILTNGTIYWEFYHNLYRPSQYTDFEFELFKPTDWNLLESLDPTLQPRSFEGGQIGDKFIKINKTNAIFPGWWYFKATSPNYLDSSNTLLKKQGQWVYNSNFSTGESTQISTQLINNGQIPKDAGEINLTIYHPDGTIFFTESKPSFNGNVTFSQIEFGAFNTSGGKYEYTLFWSNGTALGGLKSSFIINHQSTLTLLKPEDAKKDLRTEGFVGDLIPLQILLKDAENNLSISNSIISYNWTDGIRYINTSVLGIYEVVLDTADLATRGLHKIIIRSSTVGFFTSNLTLEINLGEETNLQVLESDYNIELHANGTIKLKFTDFDGDPINNAQVNISIDNPSLYTIKNPGNGVYNIEFSTRFINDIGIYQLSINFSAIAYEPQYYTYQFQIIQQSVNLSTYINSEMKSENSVIPTNFNEEINISLRAISNIDREFLSEGIITYISEDYEINIPEGLDFWYNTSITCSPDKFSLGINLVYLKFEHANYRTATFSFQILVNQLEINVDPVNFEDSINAEIGDTINIQIQLLDPNTNASIQSASVRYFWHYGFGSLNETTQGLYQTQIELPENLKGTFGFDIFITPDGDTYQRTKYSFVVVISEPIVNEPEFPNYLLWIIIGVLISIVSALGILSLRTYVYMPRKRRREAELLSKTQRFKDLKNIQAIVIIHKLSGIPIYSRSYSILERHKKELFSGFIQAITMIGEEFAEKEVEKPESTDKEEGYGVEKIMELDFKQFYCLIADIEDLRAVFILKERSSERLKSQVSHLILALNLKLSKELEDWDGSLDKFQILVPEILNEYFELYYKESFKLSSNINLITLKKEKSLSKMEMRIINVIQSMSQDNIIANLNNIVDLVHEENKNLIIEAIESLIKRKIILPLNN